MARVIRLALALALLASYCTGASAEPVTAVIAAIGTALSTVTVGTILTYAVMAYSLASSVYGSMQAKKQARRAAERKFQEDVANLQDRTTSVVAGDDPWAVIYGQPAPIGGSLKAVITSGDKAQYKHLVLVLAAHECESVDDVLIDGESLQLNSYGSAQHPSYQLEYGIPRDITYPFEVKAYPAFNSEDQQTHTVYAALVDTSADGQFYSPQVVSIQNSGGGDVTLTMGNRLSVPGQINNIGFALLGDESQLGLTGNVTIRVDGGGSAVHVSKHLSRGGVDFADPILRGAQPTLWTEDHKLTGYTYLVITINLLLERFQGGMPTFTARVKGKRCYDPRTGATAYTRNPAICLADFLRSEAGYLARPEQVDENSLIAAANACDQVVYGEGAWADGPTYGYDTRIYTCDGMFRSDQDRDTTRQQIEDAMAGYSLESGGVWRILAGAWTTPVMALSDEDMLGPVIVVQTCNPGTQRYNGARGSYVNQARNGVTEDYTPYQNAVFRAADAKDKFLDLALTFTGSHARTHQLARTLVEQSRGGFILQINPKMSAWHLQPGDRVTLSSVVYGFTNKYFRIQEWTYSTTSPLAFQLIEDEPSFYDIVDAVVADPAPNTNLPSPFLRPEPPLDLSVVSGATQVVVQGGSVIVRAHVTWSQSPSPAVRMGGYVRVQWRTVAPVGDWVTTDLPGDAVDTYLVGLNVNSEYQVRVRFSTAYVSSDWSLVSHTLRGVSEIPGDVGGLTVTLEATGAVARWSPPEGMEQLNWGGTLIRVGSDWESAIERFSGKALIANIGWLPSGTVRVWAAHYDAQGSLGVPISTTIDIAAPAQPIVHGEVWSSQIEMAWQDCRTSQPISAYIIKVGPTHAEAVEIGRTPALKFTKNETAGTRLYWVTAFDVGGNGGNPGYVELAALPSIDEALAELQEGLDQSLADLLNVNTGISGRLVDEVLERGTSITELHTIVTEGDEQLAQSIQTVAALAVGYVRANLVYNGGFEFDLDLWTPSAGVWTIFNDAWGTSARVTEAVPASGWMSSDSFPVEPGAWYAGSGDTLFESDTGISGLALEFFDGAEASLGSTGNLLPGAHDFSNEKATRNTLAVEAQAPAGAVTARVVFVWSGYTGAGEIGLRYVKGEQGRFPVTPYTAETSDRGAVAAVRQEVVARANAISAEAAARTTLAVRVDDNEASIEEESIVRAEVTGELLARWGLKVVAGNKTAGILLNNDGEESDMIVLVDRFAISTISETGEIKYPFVVGNVAGTSTVGIDGNLVVDGTITARTINVNQLSAITARLGYVTAGQLDISGDGVGGWGYMRSAGKWLGDGNWGWVFARHTDGDTFVELNCNGMGLQMHGADGSFRLWGPNFNLDNSGLTINQIDVIDTLNVRGQAITVPSFASSASNIVSMNHFVPGAANLDTFILGTTFLMTLGSVAITVDGATVWIGAGVAGSTVSGGVTVNLTPGSHTIGCFSTSSAGSAGTSVYALSTRR